MAERIRPKISITIEPETLEEVDKIAERFGENRSRVLERLVADGVWQHRHIGKSSGPLPDILEVYRHIIRYPDRYEMGGLGIRANAHEVKWDELPPELQALFPPDVSFPVWKGTVEMIQDERAALEHTLESTKERLARLKSKAAEAKQKGGK